ncbi:MAG: DUF3795 domain-containing protein [Planctomycetota bacterium]|jgi:hypothetical protein
MDEIIAYCGLTCHTCPIFLATRENNDEKRHKMRVDIARQIKEVYGTEYEADDIADCDGCRAKNGRVFSKDCQIRKCALEKDIESCGNCTEYACEKLEKLFTTDPEARQRLDRIRSGL